MVAKDLLHGVLKNGKWVKKRVSTSAYPWAVRGQIKHETYVLTAFKTKKAAQEAAKGLRRLREYGTQKGKPNTVSVVKRRH